MVRLPTPKAAFLLTRARLAAPLLLALFLPELPLSAEPVATKGKPRQLSSPDAVPQGLEKSDWQSIRAAYEAGRHAFHPVEGGWQARNPGQQWTTQFDGRGFTARPKGADWQWGLELESYGFGDEQTPIQGKPAVKSEGQRLSYQWDANVQEWFVNDQRGLEHGFTIGQRPVFSSSSLAVSKSSPLSFTLTTRGGLTPRVSAQGVAFQNASGSTVLNYSGLKVWDAEGKDLPARFEPAGRYDFRLLVDDAAAQYPITIDPIAQQAYLKASNTGAGDSFGQSVAVDGDTVVIGAYQEDSSTTGVNSTPDESAAESGAAYVFTRSAGTWSQQAYLKASNTGTSDYFGCSVAISGDTIVVGAFQENSSSTGVNSTPNELAGGAGAAYVFTRSAGTWTQQAYLKASNTGASDSFGYAVAISGDTVVIGAYLEDSGTTGVNSTPNENSSGSGAAYVFTRSAGTWSQQAYLKASNTGGSDYFGASVAVSGDTVVIGAYQEAGSGTGVNPTSNNNAVFAGAAYVFARSAGTWSQQAYLKASNTGTTDYFGSSVAVSGDTVVIGAFREDSSTTGVNSTSNNSAVNAGAAYVFTRSAGAWSHQAYLKASNTGAYDSFGVSVAVSGNTVVIGANEEDSSTTGVNSTPDELATDSGAAYVFTRSAGTWTEQAYLKSGNTGGNDRFGRAVAISGDTAVISANLEDSSTTGVNSTPDELASNSGAAYIFNGLGAAAPAPTVTDVSPATGSTAGGTSVTITGTGFTGATAVTFGGNAATIGAVTDTSITATTPAHAVGVVDVAVTTPGGTGTGTGLYTYAVPVITASITATTPTAVENGATGLFTLTRSGGTSGALQVNFQRDASSTATAGLDYTLSGAGLSFDNGTGIGSIIIPDGSSTTTITLTAGVEYPNAAEAAETTRFNVTSGSGYTVATAPDDNATVTITENSFLVTTEADSGTGSLRQAIANANSIAGADTVTFSDGSGGSVNFYDGVLHTITLITGEMPVTSVVTLAGTGADFVGISGNNASRILLVNLGASLTLNNLTLTNGRVSGPPAPYGGAVRNFGTLRVNRCALTNNYGQNAGGAISNENSGAQLTIIDSTLAGNSSPNSGGAVYNNNAAQATILNSTLSGNSATGPGSGGGVYSSFASLTMINCTLSGNSADGSIGGGALYINGGASTTLTHCTITGNSISSSNANSGGGGIQAANNATITLNNTIVIGNTATANGMLVPSRADCARFLPSTDGSIYVGNHALTGDGTGGPTGGTNLNVASAAAVINPTLASNGGRTQTHALAAGSPALNAGGSAYVPADTYDLDGDTNTTEALPFDQRGSTYPRAFGTVDIGAYEIQALAPVITSLSPDSGTSAGGTSVTITGSYFLGATAVTFGGNAATLGTVTNTSITVTTPAGMAGPASVVVTTLGGTNAVPVFYTYITPEIVVHDGSHALALELTDGQVTAVNFGGTAPNVASVRSFLVRNTGDAPLDITTITVPSGYLTNGAATTLAPGTSYGFQVSLESATPATYAGNVVINNNDLDEAVFDFPITGSVVTAGSAPVVNVGGNIAVQGTTGSAVLGGPIGSTLFSFIGSPALNSSGVLASAVQIRHADASLHTGMMVGQPMVLIATDTQTAPSLPGVTHFNFGPPVINETGHIAFTGEVRGAGITVNSNSRCLFSNASDGSLKLVARAGTNVGLTSNLKTIGNFSIGGDLVIFLGTLVDNSIVLFGWDANTGLRPLIRNGQSLDANGVTKTVKNFSVLETSNASSGHGKEISVAPTGESLVTVNVTFTDNSSGVVVGSFDGTSDTGFGATYGASQQLADTYASPAVIPLAKWSTFRSPGFDNTGNYYGFISQMVTNTLAGVTSTNNVGVFVDTAPGVLTLQLRENDTATGTGGLVFSDFSDLVLGGGDYEFLVKGEVRGSGVVVNVNDKGLWAQHATNGLVLVAREGSEAPGVAGSTFFRLTQIALPGTAQPMFQASMTAGAGGVTTANDTGLWVINEAGEVKLAVREGDVINVAGTPRTVSAITALLNGTTTGGALGRRVFLEDGQLTLLLTFSGGIQAHARVVVP